MPKIKLFLKLILIFNIIIIALSYNIFKNPEFLIPDNVGFVEKFNPELFHKIKNIDQLNNYVNSEAKKKNISIKSLDFLNLMSDVVERRFYYEGYAFHNINDNIILYYLGKYIWTDLAAIVIPDDILKKDHAACSQQSLVLMELAKINGFSYRKIGLARHFALEINLNNEWYFFDPTFEVNFNPKRNSINYFLHNKEYLYASYEHIMNKESVDWRFKNISYGKVNTIEGIKMYFLHKIIKFYVDNLTYITLLILLLEIILRRIFTEKPQKNITENQQVKTL